ncbi:MULTISPECIES: hypothetical protein [Clostridium]|nr:MULTISPECIES: hypothetical protein [Clostridium]
MVRIVDEMNLSILKVDVLKKEMFYKMLREAKASIRQNGFTKKKRGVKR